MGPGSPSELSPPLRLTPNRLAEAVDGYVLSTAATAAQWESEDMRLGDARAIVGEGSNATPLTKTVLRQLGDAAVVELREPGELDGLTSVSYAWRTPYGTYWRLAAPDVPAGDYNAITWDDGVDRVVGSSDESPVAGTAATTAPGSPSCMSLMFSVEDDHVDGDWRAAGRTADGLRVFVPVAGGNDASRAVRGFHEAESWTILDDGEQLSGAEAYALTGCTTDETFLDANACSPSSDPTGSGSWVCAPTRPRSSTSARDTGGVARGVSTVHSRHLVRTEGTAHRPRVVACQRAPEPVRREGPTTTGRRAQEGWVVRSGAHVR